MAEFLHTTHAVYSKLDDLIREARKFIVIVSPYISFEGPQLVLLKKAADNGVPITIIYRLDDNEAKKNLKGLSDFPGIKIIGCPELHAKIYATEDAAIISSKNLTARTTVYSVEIGILYERKEEFYDSLIETTEEIKAIQGSKILVDNSKHQSKELLGYCIRCGKRIIRLNRWYPLCPECYGDWSRYRNRDYVENYCHFCGKRAEDITFNYPVETGCYSKYLKAEESQNSWY